MFVNGSSTQEITIHKALDQGDQLAHFLFLLFVEDLSDSIRIAYELGEFVGFKVGSDGLEVSNLQYAYVTLLINEAYLENLWIIKIILHCIELASGMRVNFA
jgi:hypothetical protein